MRQLLISLCLIFAITNDVKAGGFQSPKFGRGVTYDQIPADVESLICTDPTLKSDCKAYFAGFADTLDLIFATDPKGKAGDGLCGDISDLNYEFAHEVQTNPKARSGETHAVLTMLLIRDHNCATLKGEARIQNNVSAGWFVDTCHFGEIGYSFCLQYQGGFFNSLLFSSEMTGQPVLCGDQRLLNTVSLSKMLNDRLLANFKLRRNPAVAVMLDTLKENMPCPNK